MVIYGILLIYTLINVGTHFDLRDTFNNTRKWKEELRILTKQQHVDINTFSLMLRHLINLLS